mmetsp:Transcript_100534/g.262061  ORF Transcript_100534/g.262061 Transcript_100534/m.262061 type:complete len:264 (-) Transcript_100534:738-1529(-)
MMSGMPKRPIMNAPVNASTMRALCRMCPQVPSTFQSTQARRPPWSASSRLSPPACLCQNCKASPELSAGCGLLEPSSVHTVVSSTNSARSPAHSPNDDNAHTNRCAPSASLAWPPSAAWTFAKALRRLSRAAPRASAAAPSLALSSGLARMLTASCVVRFITEEAWDATACSSRTSSAGRLLRAAPPRASCFAAALTAWSQSWSSWKLRKSWTKRARTRPCEPRSKHSHHEVLMTTSSLSVCSYSRTASPTSPWTSKVSMAPA